MNEHASNQPPSGTSDGFSFRFALSQVAKAVELVYRTADRLCCTDPVVSAHVLALGDELAAAALASFRQWPQVHHADDDER